MDRSSRPGWFGLLQRKGFGDFGHRMELGRAFRTGVSYGVIFVESKGGCDSLTSFIYNEKAKYTSRETLRRKPSVRTCSVVQWDANDLTQR